MLPLSARVASALEGEPLGLLADAEIVALAREAEEFGRIADALRVQVAGELDARAAVDFGEGSLAHRHGCRNATELLQRVTQVSGRTASTRFALARETRCRMGLGGHVMPPRFPAVAAALGAGALGCEAAAVITRVLGGLPDGADREDVVEAERCLVAAACGTALPDGGEATLPLHADDVRVAARVWAAAIDQDGAEPSFEELQRRRSFRFGAEKDGLVPVHGAVVPEVAALFGRMIDAITSPRTRRVDEGGSADGAGGSPGVIGGTGRESGKSSSVRFVEIDPGGPASLGDPDLFAPRDERTSDQKRHDALAVIAQAAALHDGMPTLGGAPVTVMIQVTAAALEAGHGTAWLTGHDGEPTPIPVRSATHSACAGSRQHVVQDETGRVIALGTRDRVFNAHQRRALAVRDGGCIIPGCTVPAAWCEIHHVTEHANGGATHLDNGVALCWHHHRTLDTGGWQVRMRGGLPETLAPPWIDHDTRWRPARSPLRPPERRRRRE